MPDEARQKQAAAAFLVPVMRGILETHRGRPPVAHVARFLETRRSRTPEPNIARHFGNPPELRPGVARAFHAAGFCRPARCVT